MIKIKLERYEKIQYDLANSEKFIKKPMQADKWATMVFGEQLTSLGIQDIAQ